jgi:hypothetical protein
MSHRGLELAQGPVDQAQVADQDRVVGLFPQLLPHQGLVPGRLAVPYFDRTAVPEVVHQRRGGHHPAAGVGDGARHRLVDPSPVPELRPLPEDPQFPPGVKGAVGKEVVPQQPEPVDVVRGRCELLAHHRMLADR